MITHNHRQPNSRQTPVVSLTSAGSPILSRELLCTAVTRARERVTVVGTEAAVRSAVGRPIRRASGLRERLWPQPGTERTELSRNAR